MQVGETAVFPCNYTGSNRFPDWIINDAPPIHRSQLPLRHVYMNRALYVYNSEVTDNLTQYKCQVYDSEIYTSDIGVLYILKQG